MQINGINQTPKINIINFYGSDKKSKPKRSGSDLASNPLKSLPDADKSMAINPAFNSEFLNESDLKRYKQVQKEWAQTFARHFNIPFENVMARLPEIVLGDAKEMIEMNQLAHFAIVKNSIEISPIREIAFLNGSDESKIVHESLHAYLNNLGRAYCKGMDISELFQRAANIVLEKMTKGEHSLILSGFATEIINNEDNEVFQIMHSPALSQKERSILGKTIEAISREHIRQENENYELIDLGKAFIKDTLISQLDEYPKVFEGSSQSINNQVSQKIIEYVNSYFARTILIISHLASYQRKDLEKNLQMPLSKVEKNLAENYIKGLLSTIEGSMISSKDKNEFINQTSELYFTSYEEIIARKEESLYRLSEINKKITRIKRQGLEPAEALLKEEQIVKNNLKLSGLVEKYLDVKQRMISAPKDYSKLKIVEALSIELKNMYDELFFDNLFSDKEFKNKRSIFKEKLLQYNQQNTPDNLMADTKENNTLRLEYEKIMAEIRKIAPRCDLVSIPSTFYKSEKDFKNATYAARDVFEKWVKRLA